MGGIAMHTKTKQNNPEKYYTQQSEYGKLGGIKCRDNKIGIHSLTEEEKKSAREKGTKTIVENKIGMFSDEFREKHKITLHKKIKTPDGTFESMKEAADFYNVVAGTITYIVNNWKGWYYE